MATSRNAYSYRIGIDFAVQEGKFKAAKKENRLDIFDIQPEATITFMDLSERYLKQPKEKGRSLWRTKMALDKINIQISATC